MILNKLQKLIDEVDLKMLSLLNERASYVLQIGKIKRQLDIPVHNFVREKEILQRLSKKNKGPFSNKAVENIYQAIISNSKKLEIAQMEEFKEV